VRCGTLSFVLVVIYRPDPASALSVNDDFFVDFARVLERTSSFAGCMFVGDVNVHLDDATTAQVIQLVSLLDGVGLHDVVRQPTHLRGHQLDVFITRTDQPTASVRVDPPLLSDHSLITVAFNTLSVKQVSENMPVWRRHWRPFDANGFIGELQQSRLLQDAPSDVSELVACYNSTLTELLDKIAPWRLIRIRARPTAPWFDASCHHMKATTRKLEKAYRRRPSAESRSAWRTQFDNQRVLFQARFVSFWSAATESCGGNARALWSKLRPLLEPEPATVMSSTATDCAQFFTSKVERIRASTATSPPPQIEDRLVKEPLLDFRPATVDEVTRVLVKSRAKQCSLDRVPTWLVKRHSDILAPVITDICNASFQQVKLTWCCKTAIIRPRLKKRTLDPNDLGSYRPISSLGFLSKVVEKVVDARLAEHVSRHRLLSVVQSAYRPFHSTETAIVRVVNDMISVVDQGHIGALMLLDLSAAFDTVDHSIPMEVLKRRFGVEGNALGWLAEFLRECSQIVRLGESESDSLPLHFGLPQGSVIGPKRFIEYTEDVNDLFVRHGMCHHLFADDKRLDPNAIVRVVNGWMAATSVAAIHPISRPSSLASKTVLLTSVHGQRRSDCS